MFDLEYVKNELKKFDKFKFYEEPHVYTYLDDYGNEKEISISVTALVSNYENYFDEEGIAGLKSLKTGISKDEILEKWRFDREFACLKGTHTHLYNEYLWGGKNKYSYDKKQVINDFGYDVLSPIWDKLKSICDKFYEKYKDNLIPIGLEQVIGSVEYDVAGSIDFLAYSKKLDSIIIIDYKTNKEIKTNSFNDKKMLPPLDDITDCNYYHYSLQLSMYKIILEKETNLKICPKKWLVWINENNISFKLYNCANLDEKAKEILEDRKKSN